MSCAEPDCWLGWMPRTGSSPERKESTMELLVLIIGLVTLGLLAMRFGYDSRPGFGTVERGIDAFGSAWTDPIYDQELARETREARLRRLGRDEAVITFVPARATGARYPQAGKPRTPQVNRTAIPPREMPVNAVVHVSPGATGGTRVRVPVVTI